MTENDRRKRRKTPRWYLRQFWRDLLSVYYANTPTWRWLKSGALFFFGMFLWTSGAVLLSVRPEWTLLHYVMAYGFLLLVWGPFTHFVVVPVAIRWRRTGTHPIQRVFARNSGKINLTVFFALVVLLGAFTPGIMMFEFGPIGEPGAEDAGGELVCDVGEELVTCQVENPRGIDHVVAHSGGEEVARAEEPPFAFEVNRADLEETRTGKQFTVDYRDEDGETLRRFVQHVPD